MKVRKTIDISPTLKLPANAVTQKIALLGNSGSGKTYGTGKLVESLIDASAQVAILDVVGNWWGLRVAANGRSAGLKIPIIGGNHGDVALDPSHGKLCAETLAGTHESMIIDLSDLMPSELRMWMIDFATHFLRLKKREPSPVFLVWEECQDILPQVMAHKDDVKVAAAAARLIKLGRNYGVGTGLISQRAAAVNKDVLNLAETIFAFRTTARQDRDAMARWATRKAEGAIDLVNELPELDTGEAFVWSPQWLQVFERMRFGRKWTFDSTRTPDFDARIASRSKLAPVDLVKFRERMGAAIEKAKENDPDVLRKRIAVLERATANQSASKLEARIAQLEDENTVLRKRPAKVAPAAPMLGKRETKKLLKGLADFADVARVGADIVAIGEKVIASVAEVAPQIATVKTKLTLGPIVDEPSRRTSNTGTPNALDHAVAKRVKEGSAIFTKDDVHPSLVDDADLPEGEAMILRVLIQHPDGLSRSAISAITGYKKSTRNAYISRLDGKGLTEPRGAVHVATAAGRKMMPNAKPLPIGEELLDHWLRELPEGEGKILLVTTDAKGQPMSREAIGEAAHIPKKSTRNAYISRLVAKNLLVAIGRGQNGTVKASQTLSNGAW